MILDIKQLKKDLAALDKSNLKIKFKDKVSLTELKDILIQTKAFGNNLKKSHPNIETKDFEIDRLVTDLNNAFYKERISRKKLKEIFAYTTDIMHFHVYQSLSAQLSRF